MAETIIDWDVVYPWRNQKRKEEIIQQINVTEEQKKFLLDGKFNRYLGDHFIGIKGKEIYLFNKKDKRYLKEYMGDYLYLDTNIYQYKRLKEAEKLGIKSGILLYERNFYPISIIESTKSGNMKIPVDDFINKFEQDFKIALEEYIEKTRNRQQLEEMEKIVENGKVINFFGWHLDEWERCSYRLVKSIREGVNPYHEYVDSIFVKQVLVRKGIDFEKEKLSEIKWEKTKDSLETLIKKGNIIYKPYLELDGSTIDFDMPLCFKKIIFKGTPEIICPYKGSMVPLDIKSHKDITNLDKVRICYYAFIMSALFDIQPTYGLIWTNDGIVEVELNRDITTRMVETITHIWYHLNSETLPKQQRSSQCSKCKLEKTCMKDLREKGDLTLIFDVGPKTAMKMHEKGISNIEDLLLQDKFSKHKLQAESMVTNKIIKVGELEKIPDDAVYVDIETTIGGWMVWMIGYSYEGTFYQLYADKQSDEKRIIEEFLKFLKTIKNPVLVGYSRFDYGQILQAVKRHGLDAEYFLKIKYIDLYWSLRRSYLFPTITRKLKDLGHYLGYKSKTDLDGVAVALVYERHLETCKPLPKNLFDYNKDDILLLLYLLKRLDIYDNNDL